MALARGPAARARDTTDDAVAGQIITWLKKPVASRSNDDDAEPTLRDEVCLVQIWVDCLATSATANNQVPQMLGRAMRLVPG